MMELIDRDRLDALKQLAVSHDDYLAGIRLFRSRMATRLAALAAEPPTPRTVWLANGMQDAVRMMDEAVVDAFRQRLTERGL